MSTGLEQMIYWQQIKLEYNPNKIIGKKGKHGRDFSLLRFIKAELACLMHKSFRCYFFILIVD